MKEEDSGARLMVGRDIDEYGDPFKKPIPQSLADLPASSMTYRLLLIANFAGRFRVEEAIQMADDVIRILDGEKNDQ